MSGTETLLAAEARVPTAAARRYLGQLCKHFRHKLPVEIEESYGRIEFPAGVCELDAAAAGLLVLRVSAGEEEGLARLEEVVGRHLERFAFREEMKVSWKRAG